MFSSAKENCKRTQKKKYMRIDIYIYKTCVSKYKNKCMRINIYPMFSSAKDFLYKKTAKEDVENKIHAYRYIYKKNMRIDM